MVLSSVFVMCPYSSEELVLSRSGLVLSSLEVGVGLLGLTPSFSLEVNRGVLWL